MAAQGETCVAVGGMPGVPAPLVAVQPTVPVAPVPVAAIAQPAPVAPANAVALNIEPPSNRQGYQVRVTGEGGVSQNCEAPCTLQLPSGRYNAVVSGAMEVTDSFYLSPNGGTMRLRRRSGGRALFGILLFPVGGLGVGFGIAGGAFEGTVRTAPFLALFIVGVVVDVLGAVILLTAGNNKIVMARRWLGAAPRRLRLDNLVLAPIPGGGAMAGVGFQF